MDKFQDAYRQAAEGLPHISMDAEKIREGLPRQAQRVRRYLIARGCTAGFRAEIPFLSGWSPTMG